MSTSSPRRVRGGAQAGTGEARGRALIDCMFWVSSDLNYNAAAVSQNAKNHSFQSLHSECKSEFHIRPNSNGFHFRNYLGVDPEFASNMGGPSLRCIAD